MTDPHYQDSNFRTYDHAAKMAAGYEFTIDYRGLWYVHSGPNPGPVKRKALAALFGGAGTGFMAGKGLSRDENGHYWLSSPDGKYGVAVEDVPFLIKRYEIRDAGTAHQEIDLYTDFDEPVPLGPDHPLEIAPEPVNGTDVFYVEVRAGLKARFDRGVYSDIVARHLEETEQGDGSTVYTLRSRGEIYEAGTLSMNEI